MALRLLIVDDEKEIAEMLSRHFRFLGHSVRTATDGVDAVEKMREGVADVVISDISMPRMDGATLCGHIRADFPFTRVIMMTGHVSMDNALRCIRRGADHFVLKPLTDLTELEDAVNQAAQSIQHWKDVLRKVRSLDGSPSPKEMQ